MRVLSHVAFPFLPGRHTVPLPVGGEIRFIFWDTIVTYDGSIVRGNGNTQELLNALQREKNPSLLQLPEAVARQLTQPQAGMKVHPTAVLGVESEADVPMENHLFYLLAEGTVPEPSKFISAIKTPGGPAYVYELPIEETAFAAASENVVKV